MNRFVVFAALLNCASALFSIGYYSSETGTAVVNGNAKYNSIPDSLQIADLYSRLSGNAPLVNEEKVNLPTLNDFNSVPRDVLILEVFGGNLPKSASTVAKSSAKVSADAPVLQSVLEVLSANNVKVSHSSTITAEGSNVEEWLSKQTAPVFVVHHTGAASVESERELSDDTNSGTVTPLTEFQISQYQIVLWFSVIFFLLLLSAVCSIANMEVIPDSLLYAKFQSGRTGKSD